MGPLPKERLHYEGSDWETQSWPLARAYDLLGRIQDLSLFQDSDSFQEQSLTPEQEASKDRLGYDVATAIMDISEDLRAQIILAQGDLYPCYNANHFAARLQFFQVLLVLEDLQMNARALARWYKNPKTSSYPKASSDKASADPAPSSTPRPLFESMHHSAEQIKTKLKLLDT